MKTLRSFNDPSMARMYQFMLENGDPSMMRGGSGTTAAFLRGYRGALSQEKTYPRNTLAYAAWAAGVDRRNRQEG